MAEAAVTFLLENVGKLVAEQVNLISGAEEELKSLQNELELMKAFLKESANKLEKGELFIQFGRQIREAVYEAEDIIDTCITKKAKSSGCLYYKNPNLPKKVKELMEKLKPLFDRAIVGLNSLPRVNESAAKNRTGTSDDKLKKTQSLREDNVVGFVDEEATIIEYLNQETEELDVISIVGMPGLGKTTLAWKIYNHPEIQRKFSRLIWVYVSQTFNAKKVFLTILKKLLPLQDMSTKGIEELTELVRSHLDKGEFLLFIDDVWTVNNWKQIEAVLTKKNKSGKVLITSRHSRVAKKASSNREPHKLRFLTPSESWELLQQEVFRNNSTPQELEELGIQIARQCGGVPLSVVVIGGILVEKCVNRRDLWKNVSDSVSRYLLDDDDEERTGNMISLSYEQLSDDLRDCFLYLGMFPENTEISAWTLTQLWIAEGLIQQKRGRSLEEVAEDKLKDLVARNLVMVEKTKANGDVKTCLVHDVIREFCQNEAAFANKNLFQEVKKTRQGVFDPSIPAIVKCRRLCIHSNVIEFVQKKPNGPGVRSLVCFSKEKMTLTRKYDSLIPSAFELLRVIDLNPINFTRFPPKLTELIHLRYIVMSAYEFKLFPKDISKLWNLQTLKIDTTLPEIEIKADISKLMNLRHLKTKAAISLKEMKGEGGEHLQTLSRLSAKCCKQELFNRASNLKNLGIRGDLTSFVNENYLGKLELLENVTIVHEVFPVTADKALHRVPDQNSFPPNLRMLTLSSTYLDWDQMTTLGSLPNLEVLKLKEMAFKGSLFEAQGGGFPRLQSLYIACSDLEKWTATGDPFPNLKNLILKDCQKLQEIPSILGKRLQSLQLVGNECFSPKLVQFAEKFEAEKQQMQSGQARTKGGGSKPTMSSGDASASTSSTTD